jgi:hypothetical protein
MKRKTHGLVSLGLAALALAACAVAALSLSPVLGMAYMLASALAVPMLLYAFCAKCESRSDCGHVFPGRAASGLFRNRAPGPYTRSDIIWSAVALAVLFLLPLAWLWRRPVVLALYLVLMTAAFAGIRGRVCPDCGNTGCPGNRRGR